MGESQRQLVAVWTSGADSVSFAYDATGRRMKKWSVSTTRQFVQDGDDLFLELDGAGARVAEYTYYPGVDRPLSVRRAGQTYYFATDYTGHVVGLVSASNALVNEYRYAPYGTSELAVEGVSNELEFGARERDTETGLYYNRARYYDPSLGRFVSEDPIGLGGGSNVYAYVNNAPVDARDPSGLCVPPGSFGNREYADGSGRCSGINAGEGRPMGWGSGGAADAAWAAAQERIPTIGPNGHIVGPCPGSARCSEILAGAHLLQASAGAFCQMLGSDAEARFKRRGYSYDFESFPANQTIYALSSGPGERALLRGTTILGEPAFASLFDMAVTIAHEELHHFLWGSPNGPSRDPLRIFDDRTIDVWGQRCAGTGTVAASGI